MTYELTCLIPLKYAENDLPNIILKLKRILEKKNISTLEEENLGKRKIAYPIKTNRHGYFVNLKIKTEPKNLPPLNNELPNFPEIIRYSITKFKPFSFEAKRTIPANLPNEQIAEATLKNPKKNVKEKRELKKKEPQIKKSIPNEINWEKPPKTAKPKVALEDLDKKLDEILSDNILN